MDETRLALVTSGLRRSFGDLVAVDGIDLRVPEGSLYGFLGPNGAGKSTTIKCLTGLLKPSGGTMRILGLDPLADPVAGISTTTTSASSGSGAAVDPPLGRPCGGDRDVAHGPDRAPGGPPPRKPRPGRRRAVGAWSSLESSEPRRPVISYATHAITRTGS